MVLANLRTPEQASSVALPVRVERPPYRALAPNGLTPGTVCWLLRNRVTQYLVWRRSFQYSGLLGNNRRRNGTATINGIGSKWTNSGLLYVGFDGQGILNVQAGAEVTNTNSFLGEYNGVYGIATVTGTGSKWTNTGDMTVGSAGSVI